jgi:hypothetical protein
MGSQKSSSESKPLTGPERSAIFQSGMSDIGGAMSNLGLLDRQRVQTGTSHVPIYETQPVQNVWGGTTQQKVIVGYKDSPIYSDTYAFNKDAVNYKPLAGAGDARLFNNGDYDKLQADVLRGNTAGLDYAKTNDLRGVNNDAAKRGIWSSGLVMQQEKDLSNAYAPAYAQAGASATQQRYGLQAGDNAAYNSRSEFNRQFAADQAKQQYESKWRPADYLAGMWNGTGGTISSGSTSGWSI